MVHLIEKLQEQDERLKNIESLLSLSKRVLNLNEVCDLTGLSKSTLYKFTSDGIIPHYKQAKHLYFNRIEVEEWLLSKRGYYKKEISQAASTYIMLNEKGVRYAS